MLEGISVVSGTYAEFDKAFMGMIIALRISEPGASFCAAATRAANADTIAKDIGRTPFFVQKPGDFENFTQQWIHFNSSSFTQGDMFGGGFVRLLPDIVRRYCPSRDYEEIGTSQRFQNFGYINDLGDTSGITLVLIDLPATDNNPAIYAWAISIMHDSTGNPDERTFHCITNVENNRFDQHFKKGKLKRTTLSDATKLLQFLEQNIFSPQVFSVIQKLIEPNGHLRVEKDGTILGPDFLQETNLTQEGLLIKTQEVIEHEVRSQTHYDSQAAEQEAFEKLREQQLNNNNVEAPALENITIKGLKKTKDAIYALYTLGKTLAKVMPEKSTESEEIIAFSKQLNSLAKQIKASETQAQFDRAKHDFEAAYKAGKDNFAKYKGRFRKGLVKLLTLLATSIGALGILELVTKRQSKSKRRGFIEKRLSFFTKTKAERLNKEIADEVRKLKFK